MMTIRAAGSNGTADIIWVAAMKTIPDRFNAGEICDGTWRNSKKTAREATCFAAVDKGRRCSTGLITHE